MTTITTAGLIPLPPSVHHSTTRLKHREAHTMLSTFLSLAENHAAYRPDSTLSERGPQASAGSTTMTTSNGDTAVVGQSNLTLYHLRNILLGMEGKRVGGVNFENDLSGRKSFRSVDALPNKRKRDRVTQGDGNTVVVTGYESIQSSGQAGKKRKQYLVGDDDDNGGNLNSTQTAEGEWQDKEIFEHEDDTFSEVGGNNFTDRQNAELQDGDLIMENDRHPGADLAQPYTEKEERDLVEIEVGDEGKKVDPREQAGVSSSSGKSKQRKNQTTESNTVDSPALSKEEKKRLKKLRLKEEQKAKYEKNEKKNRMSG